jgi:hypothetical protein
MSKYLNLQVPSSCQENWNNMVPQEAGRYCLSCQKSVVDFTEMTDSELVAYFKAHKEATCGRFIQSQLNRDLPLPGKPLPFIHSFIKFSLPALLLTLKSSVEAQKLFPPIEMTPVKDKVPAGDSVIGTFPVTGVVCDEAGLPLAGASVLLKGQTKGCVADTLGRFTLGGIDLPATLLISYVGYQPLELTITDPGQAKAIRLQLSPAVMGEVIVAGFISTKKIVRREKKENKNRQKFAAMTPDVLVYPNPVVSGSLLNVQCRSFEKGNYVAAFYTISGQLVQSFNITYEKNDIRLNLPIDNLASGTYWLQLVHQNGKRFSQQVVIRK